MKFREPVPARPDPKDYCVWRLANNETAMQALHLLFPSAEADSQNLVFFSTSDVHGTYQTIEEEEREPGPGITFILLQPRLVLTRYGVVHPKTPDDFSFLRKLRQSSWAAAGAIGAE